MKPATACFESFSDSHLVSQIVGGDMDAFATLMRRHNRKMFRAARSVLRSNAEAEDAVQEAYLRAYYALRSFRGEAKLSTWLVRIAVNEALGRLRAHRREEVPELGGAEETARAEGVAPADTNPEEATMQKELFRVVEAAVDRLPDDYRVVFMLRAIEGLDIRETADCLGISTALVKVRLFRARALLRKLLDREFEPSFAEAYQFDGARCDRIVGCVLARLVSDNKLDDQPRETRGETS